jgi:hypothetical protein
MLRLNKKKKEIKPFNLTKKLVLLPELLYFIHSDEKLREKIDVMA